MSEERPSLLVAAPISILPSTNTTNAFQLEKQAVQLLGNGQTINAVAIISTTLPTSAPVKFRHVVYAQRGITLKLQEALDIISKLSVLPPPYIALANNQYIVTSVQDKTFYCKNANTKAGGGLVIAKVDKVIVIAVYSAPTLPVEAVVLVEGFVQEHLL